MLFTDSDIITLDGLHALDSEVDQVARVEKILLSTVPGTPAPGQDANYTIIRRAWEECGQMLLAEIQAFGGGYLSSPGVSMNHLSAFHNLGGGNLGATGVSLPRARLSNVIVNSQYANMSSPLKRWMEYHCLVLLFRAAVNRKLNDRYDIKLTQYTDDRDAKFRDVKNQGLPIIVSPLSAPGALHEPNSGTWAVSTASGSGTVNVQTYQVAVTWTGASYINYAQQNNAESGPSDIKFQDLLAGQVLRVDISGLTVPLGGQPNVGIAEGISNMMSAKGWNVYAGLSGTPLYLQNATPLPVATKTYTFAGDPTTSGGALTLGQFADRNMAFVRPWQRA